MQTELFESTAAGFAAEIDAQIANGVYIRGRLFEESVCRNVRAGGAVLDYGCGPGRISRIIASHGFSVTGIDPSPAMIGHAQSQSLTGLAAKFFVSDDHGASLPENAFDGIVCSSVIEFVSDTRALLQQFRRTLKPSGVLVISYANRLSLWRRYAAWRYAESLPHLEVQHHVWSLTECRASLEHVGFEIIDAPRFFYCAPLDKRPHLRFLSKSRWIGALGLVVARMR
jgi:2-polyprenyl-3-methyl-5-hydroxy-6-metoxy-1,4-benzoquinol methylase